jgi:hypothetical protein
VVEWDGLENRCGGNPTEGSNPSLSELDLFVDKSRQYRSIDFVAIPERCLRGRRSTVGNRV